MDKIHFPYRSSSHLAFLHVAAQSGAWEEHGLDVEYDTYISSEDAHKFVADGSVEFVGGNHVSTYGARTRGDQWLYLGQTVSWLDHRLVVRADSGIDGVPDLKEKVVAIRGNHPGLNTWLFLKQHGLDQDRGDVTLERIRGAATWEMVRDGDADAALVNPPADLFAQRAGLKVIEVDPLPMVWFTTMSSGRKFVDGHPDIVERFLKGACQGIAYFKTHRQESIRIILDRYKTDGDLGPGGRHAPVGEHLEDPEPEALRFVPGRGQRLRTGQAQGPGGGAGRAHVAVGLPPPAQDRRQRVHRQPVPDMTRRRSRNDDGSVSTFHPAKEVSMWRLALALVVLLTAACSESDKKRVLEGLGHVDVVGGIAEVLAKSDTVMVSDVLSIEGTPSLTQYECITETNTCTRDSMPLFEFADTLEGLVAVTANPDVERSDIRQHNGIDLAEYSVTTTRQGVEWTTSPLRCMAGLQRLRDQHRARREARQRERVGGLQSLFRSKDAGRRRAPPRGRYVGRDHVGPHTRDRRTPRAPR